MKNIDLSKRTGQLEPNTTTLASVDTSAASASTSAANAVIVVKAISGKKLIVTFPVKIKEFVAELERHFKFSRESVKLYTKEKQIVHLLKCCQNTSIANRTCYSYKELESLLLSHAKDNQIMEKKYRHSSFNIEEREDNTIWYVFGKPCIPRGFEQQRKSAENSYCEFDSHNDRSIRGDTYAEDNNIETSLCICEHALQQLENTEYKRQKEKDNEGMNKFMQQRTKTVKIGKLQLNHRCSKNDILPYPHNPTGLSQLCAIIKKFEERVVDQGYYHNTYRQYTRDKTNDNNDNNNYNLNNTFNDSISSTINSHKRQTPVIAHSQMLLASMNSLYCEMCEHPTMQYMMAAIRNGDSVGDVNETQLYNLMSTVHESNSELFNWAEHNAELFVRMLNYDVIIAARQLFDERLNAQINSVYNLINLRVQRASLSHFANASSLLSMYNISNRSINNKNKSIGTSQRNDNVVNREVETNSSVHTNINFDKSLHDNSIMKSKTNKEKRFASNYRGNRRCNEGNNDRNNSSNNSEQKIVAINNINSNNDMNKNDNTVSEEYQSVEGNRLTHLQKNCMLNKRGGNSVNSSHTENDQHTNVDNVRYNVNDIDSANKNNVFNDDDNNVLNGASERTIVNNSTNQLNKDYINRNMPQEQPRELPCEMCLLYAEGVQLYEKSEKEFSALWENWMRVETHVSSFLANSAHTRVKVNSADKERSNNINQEQIEALENMLADFDVILQKWWNTIYLTLCSNITTKPAKVSQQTITLSTRIGSSNTQANVAEPSDNNVRIALESEMTACVDTKPERVSMQLRWLTMLTNLFCTLAEEFYFELSLTNNYDITSNAMNDESCDEHKLVNNSCNVHAADRMESAEKRVFFPRKACSYAMHRSFVNECAEEMANINHNTAKSTWTPTPTYHLWRQLISHHCKNNAQRAMETKERSAINSQLESKRCQVTQSGDREKHENFNCSYCNYLHNNRCDREYNDTIPERQETSDSMAEKSRELSSLQTHAKKEESKYPKQLACIGSALFNELWSYCLTSKSTLLWYSERDDARHHELSFTQNQKKNYKESVCNESNRNCPLHMHHNRLSNSLNRQDSMFVYLLNGNDNTVEVHYLKLSEHVKSANTCSMLLQRAKRLLKQLCYHRELLTRAHSIGSDTKSTWYRNQNESSNERTDTNGDVSVVASNVEYLPIKWNNLMITCYSLFVQPIEQYLPQPNATSSPLYIVHSKEPLMFYTSQIMSKERSKKTDEKVKESILHYFAGFIDSVHRTICLDKWCPTHLSVPWEILLMMNVQKCYCRYQNKNDVKVAALQRCSADMGSRSSDKLRGFMKQAVFTERKEQCFYHVQYKQEQQQKQQSKEEVKYKVEGEGKFNNSEKEENRPTWFQSKPSCNVFHWNEVAPNSIADATTRTCADHKEHSTSIEKSTISVESDGKSVRDFNKNTIKSVKQMHSTNISKSIKSSEDFCGQSCEYEKQQQQKQEEEEAEKFNYLTDSFPVQVGFIFHSEVKLGSTLTHCEDEITGTSKPSSNNNVTCDGTKLDENYIQWEGSHTSLFTQTNELLSVLHPVSQEPVAPITSTCSTRIKSNKEVEEYFVQIHVINNECNLHSQPIFVSQYSCCSLSTSKKQIKVSSASRLIRHWNLSPDSGVFFYLTLYTELAKLVHQKRQESSFSSFPSLATIIRFAVIANIRKFNAPWLAVEHILTNYGDVFLMPHFEVEKVTSSNSSLLVNKEMTNTLTSASSTRITASQPNPPAEYSLSKHLFMHRNKKTLPRIAEMETVLPLNKPIVATSSHCQEVNVNRNGNVKGKETEECRTISVVDQIAGPQRETYRSNDSSRATNISRDNVIKVSNKSDNKKSKDDGISSSSRMEPNIHTGSNARKLSKLEVNAKYVEEHAVNDLYEAMLNHLLLTRPTGQLNVVNSLISFVDAKLKAPVELSKHEDDEKNVQVSALQRQSIENNVTDNVPQPHLESKNEQTTLSTPSAPPATILITANTENKFKQKRYNYHHFRK